MQEEKAEIAGAYYQLNKIQIVPCLGKEKKIPNCTFFFQNTGTIPGVSIAQGLNILNDLLKIHDTNLFPNNTVGMCCFPLQEAMLLKSVYKSQIAKFNFQIK